MKAGLIREDLAALEGYHSVQVDAEVRLNTNESPFPPSAAYLSSLTSAIEASSLNRYPDRSMTALRTTLAELHRVQPSEIFCANGSNEVIQSLCLAFGGPGRTALVFEPTYALHSHIARITGTSVQPCDRKPDFTIEPTDVASAIAQVDPAITFLCSPNNPTGLAESAAVVEAALTASTGLVIVDEAYGQFASASASAMRSRPGGDRLAVIRTFSKTWALAGVRLGYLEADPSIVEGCELASLPYNVSAITQMAGVLAVGHLDEMHDQVATLVAERTRVIDSLIQMAVDVWPSESNFILFRPRGRPGRDVWADLLERSVLIRDCSSWARLTNCLRVTVGTEEENNRFILALKEAL